MPCPRCKSGFVKDTKTLKIVTHRCISCGQEWGDIEQDKTVRVIG